MFPDPVAMCIATLKARGVEEVRILAIDFDGTITKVNKYPNVGEFREGAMETLKAFQRAEGKVLLWTCREGVWLDMALQHMKVERFKPDWVNCQTWAVLKGSRKPYYDLLIDDRALSCPVDWAFIGKVLTAMAPKDPDWFTKWQKEGSI